MRASPLIDALMPRGRREVLCATLLQPDRSWYAADLARHLRVTPSSLQRELAGLTRAGLLKSRREGRMVYFQADTECPIYFQLHGLLSKTAGLADVLREALAPAAAMIRCAFVFGSVARREEGSRSDVDLMIVGSTRLSDVSDAIDKARQRLAREVSLTTYTPEEFAAKAAVGHYFVMRVLERPKLFVIGTQHDLDRLAQRPVGGGGAARKARVG